MNCKIHFIPKPFISFYLYLRYNLNILKGHINYKVE